MDLKLLTGKVHDLMESEWREYFYEEDRAPWAEGYLDLIGATRIWLDGGGKPKNDMPHYYFALWDPDEQKCWGVTKVYHVNAGSKKAYYKAMSFRTAPELDSRNGFDNEKEFERYDLVWKVLTQFIFGGITFLIDDQHEVRQFKIYGNAQMDTAFFHRLMGALSDKSSFKNKITWQFFTFKTYQKWLDIELK